MVSPGYRPGFSPIKQRVASKVARGGLFNPQLPGYRPGFPKPSAAVAPVGGTPAGSTAPIVPPDPSMPDPKDATYTAGIADIINTRGMLTSRLAGDYTNNTATATTGANKSGLLHSSALANKLADLKTGYVNDQGSIDSQYGTGTNYGTKGAGLLGEAQQRHINDPSPTVVDNDTLSVLNQKVNAASPYSHVQLGKGWRLLYDASGKPVRFLKPGETFNGQ